MSALEALDACGGYCVGVGLGPFAADGCGLGVAFVLCDDASSAVWTTRSLLDGGWLYVSFVVALEASDARGLCGVGVGLGPFAADGCGFSVSLLLRDDESSAFRATASAFDVVRSSFPLVSAVEASDACLGCGFGVRLSPFATDSSSLVVALLLRDDLSCTVRATTTLLNFSGIGFPLVLAG